MQGKWTDVLKTNPVPMLLAWQDPALTFFTRRDLLNVAAGPADALWDLPEASRLVSRQHMEGFWQYPSKLNHPAPNTNYNLLETYRSLRLLVEKYSFHREHTALQKAAESVFSCQTDEGDIRGILGNQYMPYYHGAILELLIKAGYAKDPRTEKGLQWLLSMRQADGGWLIPAQFVPHKKTSQFWLNPPLPPNRSLPHAHLATGMVLRAFAAHPDYRQRPEVLAAGQRLKERLFHADKYNDRKAPSYWLKFQFPFWWPSLVTALDTLSWLGFNRQDRDIERGMDWFLANQSADGLWETGYGNGKCAEANRCWVGLAICRLMKHFFEKDTK